MAGPAETRLMKALDARPGQLHQAAAAWRTAAQGLGDVAQALENGKSRIAASWQGRDADAATAAFTGLAATVRTNQERMTAAATALDTAGTALHRAKADYSKLPPVPPAPAAPEPDASGSVPIEREVRYLKLAGNRSRALDARESAAQAAYTDLVGSISDARMQMATAAPERAQDYTGGSGPGGGTPSGPGPVRLPASVPGLPGSTGAPVGAYATGTGGTHFSTHQVISSTAPHLDGSLTAGQLTGQVIDTSTSADGIVGGSVPGADAALGGAGAGGALTGSSGALAGGSAGGMAGLLGGGGVLGALRGAKSAAAGSNAVSGSVRGLGGAVPGVVSDGAVGGSTANSAAKGGVLGGSTRSGAPVGAVTPGSGAGSGTTGGGRPAIVGAAGSAPGGSGAGSSTGSSAGSRSGGRYLAGDTSASGGSGAAPTEGRGSRAAGMQPGARAGQGDPAREARRRSMAFEDEDAWLDDDDLGPGVMR